jgi:hypothetical protein
MQTRCNRIWEKPHQDSIYIDFKYKSEVKPFHWLVWSEDMENICVTERLYDSYHNYVTIWNISLFDEYLIM